jgi:hypothetical protein
VSKSGIKSGIGLGVVALTSAAILGAGGASAFAGAASATRSTGSASGTLSDIQSRAAAAIKLRITALEQAMAKIDRAKGLGPNVATLEQYLGADIAPLQALGQKIASDTSVPSAKTDYQNIFSDFRVIALVLPAARLAEAADSIEQRAVARLTADSTRAATHVRSTTDPTMEPLISNLNSEISAASAAVSGMASAVLGYVPSQWNANHALLSPAKATVSAASADVKQAISDERRISDQLLTVQPAAGGTKSSSSA